MREQDKKKEAIVFCHNDLNNSNVLINKADQSLAFIDFEYSGFNFRGYDFANFFNEMMMDYSLDNSPYFAIDHNRYPSYKQVILFFENYLIAQRLFAE